MTNDDMKQNRFGRWYTARKNAAEIKNHLKSGGIVMNANYLKAYQLDSRHVDMIKGTKTGLYMQSGKKWVCIDGCSVKMYRAK